MVKYELTFTIECDELTTTDDMLVDLAFDMMVQVESISDASVISHTITPLKTKE